MCSMGLFKKIFKKITSFIPRQSRINVVDLTNERLVCLYEKNYPANGDVVICKVISKDGLNKLISLPTSCRYKIIKDGYEYYTFFPATIRNKYDANKREPIVSLNLFREIHHGDGEYSIAKKQLKIDHLQIEYGMWLYNSSDEHIGYIIDDATLSSLSTDKVFEEET